MRNELMQLKDGPLSGPPFGHHHTEFWQKNTVAVTETLLAKKLLDSYINPFEGKPVVPLTAAHNRIWRPEFGLWVPIDLPETTCRLSQWDGIGKINLSNRTYREVLSIATRLLPQDEEFFSAAPRGFAFGNQFCHICPNTGKTTILPLTIDARQRHRMEGVTKINPDIKPIHEKMEPGSPLFGPPGSLLHRYLTTAHEGSEDAANRVLAMGQVAFCVLAQMGTRFGRATMCYGQPGTGKSQFIAMLMALIPKSAICTLSPQRLADERHLVVLDGKWLNAVPELKSATFDPTELKAAVFGEPVTGRAAHGQSTTFCPVATHVFCGNELPRIQGADQSVFDRWVAIRFDVRRRGTDTAIEDIGGRVGREEKRDLIEWALGCGITLIQRGAIHLPDCATEIEKTWRMESDPVAAWLDEEMEIASSTVMSSWYSKKTAFTDCSEWLKSNGFKPISIRLFRQRLENAGCKIVRVGGYDKVNINKRKNSDCAVY